MKVTSHGPHRRIQPLHLRDVTIDDAFWSPRITINREQTLDYQLYQCEETGRIGNYDKAAGKMEGTFEGIFFKPQNVTKKSTVSKEKKRLGFSLDWGFQKSSSIQTGNKKH